MFNSIKKGLSIALAGVLAVSTICVSSYETQAAEVGEYNYAKLLQESLYFYDANMCGKDVGEKSAFSWRDDCHTSDLVVIDGQTIDVSGGFHDAGDHGKFGLPQAYSATMLGISYYEYKDAYTYAGASEHLKTITNHFCEYFERCTVLNTDGSVKCFVYQVGDYTDHNYWGAPENQTGSRQVFCTSDSNTATDEVSEAASALTLQYLNFGDSTALSYAQKLFAYAKNHNKECATEGLWDPATGGYLYNSTSWGDDYALAAALLYKATNDQSYMTEFNNVKNQGLGKYNIWAWCSWDDVSAIADYYGTGSAYSLNECAKNMKKSDNGYSCLLEWGSCRYNCNTQFLGLLYDKANGSSTYKDWATFQMNYILGNNNNNQCFVIGYNENSPQYPHHRAASASGDANQISQNKKTLLGALVGGPKDANGTYTDNQGDYQCNEVALDYNAGLVCAAAALYHVYKDDTSVPSSLMTADDIADIDLRFDYNDILDECDHTWNGGVVTKNPTCTDKGIKTYTCTKCGETKTEDIAAKGHTPVTDNAKAASCTESGLTEGSHCSVCNAVIKSQTVIPALGHNYVSQGGKEATCTETGKEPDKICSRCNDKIEGKEIPAKGHLEEIVPGYPATTTTTGLTDGKRCSVCKTVLLEQEVIPIAACDHKWNDGEITVTPSCTSTGEKLFTCTLCGNTRTELIDATGHIPEKDDAVAATCTSSGLTEGSHCSVCKAILIKQTTVPAKGHVPVTDPRVEPTTTSVGWTVGSHCSVCNQILVAQEEIPMLEKENDETEEENENKEKDKEEAKEEAKEESKEDPNDSSSGNKSKDNQNSNGNESSKNSNEAGKEKTVKYSNEWINGKWYNEDGTQTYTGVLTWKVNSTGWWVEDTDGWYPTDQWQKIDGIWYYFKPDGYMAANEYYKGYWFNADGSWDSQYLLSWKVNSTGWWVEDISGWWPSGTWLKINGYWYYFNASGYMVTSCYIDGYWIGSDGVCY